MKRISLILTIVFLATSLYAAGLPFTGNIDVDDVDGLKSSVVPYTDTYTKGVTNAQDALDWAILHANTSAVSIDMTLPPATVSTTGIDARLLLLGNGSTTNKWTYAYMVAAIKASLASWTGNTVYQPKGTTYYVDSSITDTHVASATPDFTTYNPTTYSTATGSASVFKTIADLNVCTFNPGDKILLRKGQIWYEQFTPPSSGTSEGHIIVDAFGSGVNPIISGAGLASGWTTSGVNGEYYISAATCRVVIVDGARAVKGSANGSLNAGEYYWLGGGDLKLYYKPTSGAPSDHTIYYGVRNSCVNATASYLDFNNLTLMGSNLNTAATEGNFYVADTSHDIRGLNITCHGSAGRSFALLGSNITLTNPTAYDSMNTGIRAEATANHVVITNPIVHNCAGLAADDNAGGDGGGIAALSGANDIKIIGGAVYSNGMGLSAQAGIDDGIAIYEATNVDIDGTHIYSNAAGGAYYSTATEGKPVTGTIKNCYINNNGQTSKVFNLDGIKIAGKSATTLATVNIIGNTLIANKVGKSGTTDSRGHLLISTYSVVDVENNKIANLVNAGTSGARQVYTGATGNTLTFKNNIYGGSDAWQWAFSDKTTLAAWVTASSETGASLGDSVSDVAYASSWNGVPDIAPSQNAVYDEFLNVFTAIHTSAGVGVTQASLHVDDILTAIGIASEATNLGTFTGSTIPDSSTVKAALQALETSMEGLGGGHDAVTLDANAGNILTMTTQEIGLTSQAANKVLAGPASGGNAVPTFRLLTADDIPDLSAIYNTGSGGGDVTAASDTQSWGGDDAASIVWTFEVTGGTHPTWTAAAQSFSSNSPITINSGTGMILTGGTVTNPFTTIESNANLYHTERYVSATDGGYLERGFSNNDAPGFTLQGYLGATDPTDTVPAVKVQGYKLTGTTAASLGAAETVFEVQNNSTAAFSVRGNGTVNIPTGASYKINGTALAYGDVGAEASDADLAAIAALSTSGGAAVRTATNTWALRSIAVSGAGLDVSNGNGIAGNPTIALDIAPSSGSATLIEEEDALQVKYNASNFKEGASGLDTIQDIGTGASPTFSALNTAYIGSTTPGIVYATTVFVTSGGLVMPARSNPGMTLDSSVYTDWTLAVKDATSSLQLRNSLTVDTGLIAEWFTSGPSLVMAGANSHIDLGSNPGDSGALRLSNNTAISWEQSTPGTDIFIALDNSDILQVGQNATNIYLGTSGTGNVKVTGDLTVSGADIIFPSATAGVRLTGGNGLLTIKGEGDGTDEDLTINLNSSNTATVSSSTGVTKIDLSAINLATTGTITGLVPMTYSTSGVALSAVQCQGTAWIFTSAGTNTLPAAATAGYGAVILIRVRDVSEVVVIDPNGSEKINLMGTALAGGYAIKSSGVASDQVCLMSSTDTDGSGTDGWIVTGLFPSSTSWITNGS